MGKYIVPAWAKDVRKAMIDLDITQTELACGINRDRTNISKVLTGKLNSINLQKEIMDYIDYRKDRASRAS